MSDERAERTRPRRGLVGRVLGGRYRVTELVSAGATALIADALDTELERPVTLKLVRPEWAESPDFQRKFRAAMRAMSKLSHPNLAAIYDWGGETVGNRTTVYSVGEQLRGGSLRDMFDRGRYLEPSQALLVGLEACRGLDFAHRKGLVHSELTPSKLVFGDDRRLRIVDFGLSRLLGVQEWAEPATVATHVARYASPEQALGETIDGRSDVYSLALILVEGVTHQVPFAARSTVATLSARVGRLMPVSADLGPLAAVLERAGRPDPADRSTAAELGRGLVRAAENLPRPAPIPILVTEVSEDPERMRRPNDPTGGVTRPRAEPVVPVAPAAPPADTDGPVPIPGDVTEPSPPDTPPDSSPEPGVPAPPTIVEPAPAEPSPPPVLPEPQPVPEPGPAPVVPDEPATTPDPGPAPVVPDEPAPTPDPGPAPVVPDEPAPTPDPEPAPTPDSGPAPVVPDEPAPTPDPGPAPVEPDQQAPTPPPGSAPVVPDEPAPTPDSGPAPVVPDEPAPPPDPEPAPLEPAPVSDPAPGRPEPVPAEPVAVADATVELPPPVAPGPTTVYDGDVDVTKDELAALARQRVTPVASAAALAPSDAGAGPPPSGAVATVTAARPPGATAPPSDTATATTASPPSPPRDWSSGLQTLSEGRGRSRWFTALAAFLVLAALAGLGFVAYLLFRVPTHEVPDLVGLDVEAAQAQIVDFEWEVEVQRERSDEEPDLDAVVRTEPAAGADLAVDEPFLIVVSDGPEFRQLPDLDGMTAGAAETALAQLQLDVGPSTMEYSEDVDEGHVVSWSVPSDPALGVGDDVLPDTEVRMVISRGPEPRVVPDVAGQTVEEATAALEALRLVVEVEEPVFDDDVPAGAVISSDPVPGASVERDSTVTLLPSKGPDLVTLPDVTGMTLDQAGAALEAAGLQVGGVLGNSQGTVAQMRADGDQVEAGSQHLRHSVIELVLF